MEIKTAVTTATPALIGLSGPSGSGKTLSALKIARGLVGPEGKIGLIDTENRRALIYAKEASGWDHMDLQPPFSPDRYTTAFKKFEDAGGYGCVIVDSMSHVWAGDGGVLDMAEGGRTQTGKPRTGLNKWQAPKMAYRRMVGNLLRAPFHVIFCLRVKDGVTQKGTGANAEVESTGLEPICDKDFIYEMAVAVLLGPDHKPLFEPIGRFRCNPIIPAVKVPEDLKGAIKPGEFLNEQTGRAIAEWAGDGVAVDHDAEKMRREARDVATMGSARLNQHWQSLDKTQRAVLLPIMDDLRNIAKAADTEEPETQDAPDDEAPFGARPQESDGESGDPLDDEFTSQTQATK